MVLQNMFTRLVLMNGELLENTDNFDRCELCHYTYVIVPNNDPELCCANKYRRLLRHPILFYGLYFLSLV